MAVFPRLGLCCFILLSGCASIKPATESTLPIPLGNPDALHLAHLEQLSRIDQFFLEARIGIQSAGKGSSGTTRWRHDTQNNDITMISPVGNTVAKIVTDASGVTLTTNGGKVYQALDAGTLTEQHLGWRLPLEGLPDWALGRPVNRQIDHIAWDNMGRITQLTQDGWEIEYAEYMESSGYRLPKRIILHSDKLTLKLVINRWDEIQPTATLAIERPETPETEK